MSKFVSDSVVAVPVVAYTSALCLEDVVVLLFNLTRVSVFAPQDPYGHGWFVWSLPAALERGGGQRAVRM